MEFKLPTEPKKPVFKLSNLTTLIYGPPKVGKTTFANESESPIILETEPGTACLTAYAVPINCWDDLIGYCAEINKNNHNFKTIVLDTVDNAYQFCREYILKKMGVSHESELDWGKGYSMVNNEFRRVITKISQMPYGFIMISHAKDKEISTRTGKYIKATPSLSDNPREFLTGLVDLVLFCEIIETQEDDSPEKIHVIRTKPGRFFDAGDRTGKLPETIKLNYKEFANFLAKGNENE